MCELIALPLRLAASATRLGFQLTGRAVGAARHVAEHVVGVSQAPSSTGGSPRRDAADSKSPAVGPDAALSSADAPDAPQTVREIREPTIAGEPPDPTATPKPDTDVRSPQARVSEEPQLVAAFAEPGAEDGADAAVRVREPWKGYGKMTASQIIARLDAATREEMADVTLYESLHRRRRTVITGARRQLQRATAAAPEPT